MESTMQARPYGGDSRLATAPAQFSIAMVPGEAQSQTSRLHGLLRRLYMVADGLGGPVPEQEGPGAKPNEPNNMLEAFRMALGAQSVTIDMLERQLARIENSLGVNRG